MSLYSTVAFITVRYSRQVFLWLKRKILSNGGKDISVMLAYTLFHPLSSVCNLDYCPKFCGVFGAGLV